MAIVAGGAAASAAATAKAAGSSSSDSDVNNSDLESDSDGEHEELRAVVDRMMKEESDEDDDGGGPAPRCVELDFFFFLREWNFFQMLRTSLLTRAFLFPISHTHQQRYRGPWITASAAL